MFAFGHESRDSARCRIHPNLDAFGVRRGHPEDIIASALVHPPAEQLEPGPEAVGEEESEAADIGIAALPTQPFGIAANLRRADAPRLPIGGPVESDPADDLPTDPVGRPLLSVTMSCQVS